MTEIDRNTTLAWRKFMASDAGIKGMLYLREKIPSISKGDTHAMVFDAGRSEGFKQAIDTVSDLLILNQTKEVDASND
jgi:hypothetical protein